MGSFLSLAANGSVFGRLPPAAAPPDPRTSLLAAPRLQAEKLCSTSTPTHNRCSYPAQAASAQVVVNWSSTWTTSRDIFDILATSEKPTSLQLNFRQEDLRWRSAKSFAEIGPVLALRLAGKATSLNRLHIPENKQDAKTRHETRKLVILTIYTYFTAKMAQNDIIVMKKTTSRNTRAGCKI